MKQYKRCLPAASHPPPTGVECQAIYSSPRIALKFLIFEYAICDFPLLSDISTLALHLGHFLLSVRRDSLGWITRGTAVNNILSTILCRSVRQSCL